ncbi:MAG: class I SAM-dependent methyltransferase, partial [Pseudomonadota bacterium]
MSIIDTQQDAFGRALLDHFNHQPTQLLTLEVDDGWSTTAMPPTWFFQTPTQWESWEREKLEQVTGPVLDLGAGAGRASLALQQRNIAVTAIDTSPGAVEVCRKQGIQDVRLIDFLEELPSDQVWSTVLMLCGNFGLAGGWDETRDLLSALNEICAEDAVLIADTVDPTVSPDKHALEYQQQKVAAGQYIGDITLRLTYGNAVSPWWHQTNFVVGDIPKLVEGTGWQLEEHHVF